MGRKFLDQGTVFRLTGIVPIHGFIKGTGKLPIQKWAIFCKFKDIKVLRGGYSCMPHKQFQTCHAKA